MTALRITPVQAGFAGVAAAVLFSLYAGWRAIKSAKQVGLPASSPRKQDPHELDRMHDTAVADSMSASDPPSTSQPEVRGAS